jgi:hypothetical protein
MTTFSWTLDATPSSLVSSSADWSAIEAALAKWAGDASGLTAIWANQNAGQPPGDYVLLSMDGPLPVGRDGVRYVTDLERPAGQEVESRVVGERECHLLVQAFTEATLGGTAANRVIARLQLALTLPSVVELLAAAGISVFDIGPIQNLPGLLEADIQGRASMRVRFYFRDSVSEFGPFIGSVETTATIDAVETTITVDSDS